MKRTRSLTRNCWLLLVWAALTACSAKKETTPAGKYDRGVIIINEGNFSDSDGELSFWNRSTQQVSHQIFQAENQRPLAAIIQSVRLYNNRLYIITNRADKVEVVEASSMKSIATISDPNRLINPQDFAAIGNRGFITCWGPFSPTFLRDNPSLAVIDLQNHQIINSLRLPAFPQGILAASNKIFVALAGARNILVINPETLQTEASIEVPQAPQRLLVDANNRLWAVCSGGFARINPNTNQVETTIAAASPVRPNGKATMNADRTRLYFLVGGFAAPQSVYELPITASSLPISPIFTQNNLYGIGCDPQDGSIWLADHNGFQGNGTVIRLRPDGTRIGTLATGRAPNGFLFR
ncbi:MAG: hypothetical protein RMJ44_03465 [Cytophagales bacterium]|nr:hypothetical protein [Bernardetiaceae bacterium]MDW8210123.1 hypothetical protein [Cytophagales bacterium]